MSAPPYTLVYTDEADRILTQLQSKKQNNVKFKKVIKALRLLEQQGPSYPGLNSHLYQSIKDPTGQPVWESYVENKTPSAWRIWWTYGPDEDTITILTIGPHP